MPVFTIRTPSGRTYDIEAADQATAIRGAQAEEGRQAPSWGSRPVAGARGSANAGAGVGRGSATVSRPAGVIEDTIRGTVGGAIQGLTSTAAFLPTGGRASGEMQQVSNFLTRKAGRAVGLIPANQEAAYAERQRQNRVAAGQLTAAELNSTPLAHTLQADYQTTTPVGYAAQRAAQFATGALTPGGLGERAAAVLVPAAGSLFGEAVDRQLGGSGMIGGALGGMAGGVASQVRRVPGVAPGPRGIDPASPVAISDSEQAARYVQGRLPSVPLPSAPTLAARGATVSEQSGRPAQVALGSLARRPGTTADALGGDVAARQMGRPDRIANDLGNATGVPPNSAQDTIDAVVAAGRREADPLFRRVRANTNPVASPRLEELARVPLVQRAIRAAYEDMLNNPDGPPPASLFRQNPDGTLHFEPTADAWDRIYQRIGDDVARHPITGRPLPETQARGNGNIDRMRAALRSEIGRLVPEWDQAMRVSGDYLSASTAFDQGRRLTFSTTIRPRDYARRFASLTPGEQRAWRAGIADHIQRQFEAGRLNLRMFRSPGVRANLETTLGRQATAQLLDNLDSEQAMANFERRYGPGTGSPTAEFSAEHAAQDGAPNQIAQDAAHGAAAGFMAGGPKGAVIGAVTHPIARQLRRLPGAVAAQVRTGGMSQAARDEAGRMLMSTEHTPNQLLAYVRGERAAAQAARPRLRLRNPSTGR